MKIFNKDEHRPDKIDRIFLLVSSISLSFMIGANSTELRVKDEAKAIMDENLIAQANYYEEMINKVEQVPHINFKETTKSNLKEYIENLNQLVKIYQYFDLDENDIGQNFINDVLNQLVLAREALETNNYLYPYTDDDYAHLAYIIYREAGDKRLTDEHRDLAGLVAYNRQQNNGISGSLTNPTIRDIIKESGQYPYRNEYYDFDKIFPWCWDSAVRVLEHKVTCPPNVLFQANFEQGTGIYKALPNPGYYGSNAVSYYCYGNLTNKD